MPDPLLHAATAARHPTAFVSTKAKQTREVLRIKADTMRSIVKL
jgi:hypothetical protein